MVKKLDKKKLLMGLDKITTRVAKRIKKNKNKDFILVKKVENKVHISDYVITRGDDGDFTVTLKGHVVFSGIAIFDIASSLVNSIISKNKTHKATLLELNENYLKLLNEMRFYEHSLKSKSKDDRDILISRMDLNTMRLENIVDEISRYKVTI